MTGAGNPGEAWLAFLRGAAEGLGGLPGSAAAPDADSAGGADASDAAAIWSRLGEAWLRACAEQPGGGAASAEATGGDAPATAAIPPAEALAAPLRAVLDEFAAAEFGPRDWLLRLGADWGQRQLGYWDALSRGGATPDATAADVTAARLARWHVASDACAAHYAACLRRAAAALDARLDGADAPIDSLRGYFDLWVDCFEREHAAMLDDAAFARDYAALLNSALLAASPAVADGAERDR